MLKSYLRLFLKGVAMGAADVVPGVSGGTIAFITGIYEELISSISAINIHAVKLLFSGQFKNAWTYINGKFLAVLFAGVFTSIMTLASLLTYLLEHFPIVVWSFFFGLVTASIWLVGRTVREWNVSTILSLTIGAIIAYGITILPASEGASEPWYLILCGALAICAMILPGISGSFILLLLGAYSTVLAAVSDREFSTIMYVGIGAVLGLVFFTKALKWIFLNYYNTTIAMLSGFLLGSLNKLWPWKEIITFFTKYEGTPKEEIVAITSTNLSPGPEWPVALLCACAGGLLVLLLERFGKRERE